MKQILIYCFLVLLLASCAEKDEFQQDQVERRQQLKLRITPILRMASAFNYNELS
jgi:hypothetical protein